MQSAGKWVELENTNQGKPEILASKGHMCIYVGVNMGSGQETTKGSLGGFKRREQCREGNRTQVKVEVKDWGGRVQGRTGVGHGRLEGGRGSGERKNQD